MKINAKFPGRCASTGREVKRGDLIEYDPVSRSVVLLESRSVPSLEGRQGHSFKARRYTDYYISRFGNEATFV